MQACPAEDSIADLAMGQLDPDAAAFLHLHLRGCDGCRLAFAAFAESLPEGAAPDAREDHDDGLRPGQRFGHFELVQLLGMGNMGAVWSARDTDLDRLVALKTVRPLDGAAAEDQRIERLRREAQAMAALSHPNVVAVHEVVEGGGRVFVAMELVPGGTLREWLSARPRGVDEVLDAFALAGRGLAAAHAAGLVHRDFKPDNVLVSEEGTEGARSGARVRVTDFGLARISGAPGPSRGSPVSPPGPLKLTRTGAIAGTPAYMAPEQLRGEPIDARADVFAFCTALYDAVYGARPFAAWSLAELRRRTEANQVEPAPRGRAVPRWLRRVLLKGLRAAPAERWQSMDALLAAIAAGRSGGLRRSRAAWLTAGALVLAILAAALLARPRATNPAAGAARRRSLAVLPPRQTNGGGDVAWLSTALADLLGAELADGEQLRLVPGRTVAQVLADQGWTAARTPGEADLRGLQSFLGADFILGGSYSAAAAGALQVELRLYEGGTGRLAETFVEAGDASRPGELASRVGTRVRQRLQLPGRDRTGPAGNDWPRDVEAERLLAEGIAKLHAFDPAAALVALTGAAAIAPADAHVLAAQAEAWLDLGDITRARAAGKQAFAAAGKLGREQRLRIERIMEAPTATDWRRAAGISRALFTFFPDEVEYGLRLASDLVIGHQTAEAFAVLEQLRKLPPPAGQDAGIDRVEAMAAIDAGDLQRSRKAAARSAELGRARRSRRTVAHARFYEGNALQRIGDVKEATAAYTEAEELFRELGERRMLANAIQQLGFYAADRGDLEAARPRFEAVVQTHRELGNVQGEAVALLNLGLLLRRMHLPDEALDALARARALAVELKQEAFIASAAHTSGTILGDQGHLAEAAAAFEEAAAVRRRLKSTKLADSLEALAEIARLRAEAAKTRPLCEEIRALAGPEKHYQALALTCLAELELEVGHPKEAEAAAAQAAALYGIVQEIDNLAAAEALRALCLLAGGRASEAAAAIDAAEVTLGKSQNVLLRGRVGVAAARIRGGQPGQLPAAAAALRAVLAEAHRTGSAGDRFAARLALGELLVRAGDPDGRPLLVALERDAGKAGFKRAAQGAAAALGH